MGAYRIVLADDHALFRQGIKKILSSAEDLDVVGETGDGLELIELVKKLFPDMVILDISMPNLRGLEATREIKIISPEIKVLILTMHKDNAYLSDAFSSGAEGYLVKEDADTELFSAISMLRSGRHYISPLLSGDLAHELIQASHKGKPTWPSNPLTIREREILKLVAEGISNKGIADRLYISIRTVEHHRANIMRKLNIKNTANLIKYAVRMGYTSETT
jgi:DNA-binding NarL/FixJ family response regulator